MTKDEFKQVLEQNNAALFEQLGQRLEAKLDEKLEQNNAVLFGQLSRHVEATVRAEVEPLREQMGRLQATMDGVAQQLSTEEQERAAIVSEQERHNDWIGQLARSTGTKLLPDQ